MKGQSKFDFGVFYGWDERYFAVSKQRYSKEEAVKIFKQECDNPEKYECYSAFVRWRAGITEDGERDVGWWLEFDEMEEKPRFCPVWVFEYM